MLKKRIFIIHRWDGKPKSDWYPWLKRELETKGLEVFIPEMPNTEEPKIKEWIDHLSNILKNPDDNTYFIGHSIGCQTIMRYLATQNNVRVGGALFIAGWFYLDNLENEAVKEIARPWLDEPINLAMVRSSLKNLTVVLSENDPYNRVKENGEKFAKELNAKIVVLQSKGHFTEDDGITELPFDMQLLFEMFGWTWYKK